MRGARTDGLNAESSALHSIVLNLRARFEAMRADRAADGIFWNMASLLVLASSGLVLQVLIGGYFGSAALGVFNQVLVWFAIVSQFGVLGSHFSVLKHLSDGDRDADEAGTIVASALATAAVTGTAAAAAFYWAAAPIGALAQSTDVAEGIRYAAPGIFFFALNKVALAALNGLRRMRAFAVYQGLRPAGLLVACAGLAALADPQAARLCGCLTATEAGLSIVLAPTLFRSLKLSLRGPFIAWCSRHLSFGAASMPSGLLIDLNTRVDVVVLSAFVSDATVGIYSFAAMLAEGVVQTMTVVRNNINPYLTQLLARRNTSSGRVELTEFVAKWRRISAYVALVACALAIAGYPVLVWMMQQRAFMTGYPMFCVLMAGILGSAAYLAFMQALMLAGSPGRHTAVCMVSLLLNVGLNCLFIPPFGALGAALGTALALPLSWLVLKHTLRRTLQIHV